MCEFASENKCKVTGEICPYMYFCERFKTWRESKFMPKDCNIKKKANAPKGYSVVKQERKGYLYVDVDGETIRVKNPFDTVPLYVKIYKLKSGQWKLKL